MAYHVSLTRAYLLAAANAIVTLVFAGSVLAQTTPTISADPNPVPAGGAPGKTTVTWNTGSDNGVVRVSTNGGPEQEFAVGRSGSSEAPWITARTTFEFRLYASRESTRRLAHVTVVRKEPEAFIRASPNPVPTDAQVRGTLVEWSTGDGSPGRVVVRVDGKTPAEFAIGANGSNFADWIDVNHSYEFQLYRDAAPDVVVTAVVVTRVGPVVRESIVPKLIGAIVLVLLIVSLIRLLKSSRPESSP